MKRIVLIIFILIAPLLSHADIICRAFNERLNKSLNQLDPEDKNIYLSLKDETTGAYRNVDNIDDATKVSKENKK